MLDVRAGEGARFEQAFARAESLIASSSGHQRHELRRCLEVPDRYLLLVWWGPTPAFRMAWTLIVIAALFIVGTEALRRQTEREFPDAKLPDA